MKVSRRSSARWAVLLVLALGPAGCGSDEDLSAEEFVEQANAHGARLELGAPLESAEGGEETHSVQIAGSEGGSPEQGSSHSGGSLVVADDESAGLGVYRRCSKAPALVCYRAANVVLYHEQDVGLDVQRRIRSAVLRMAG